jgi:decaprenylphospho-beta-D-ribofuranose 2-oxidase
MQRAWRAVEAWGMTLARETRVLRPRSTAELLEAFSTARAAGRTLTLRGSGNSYGDASLPVEQEDGPGWTLDCTRWNRILAFDPATGIVEAEPGVTVRDLWRHVLPHGWWPRVVSGTAFPTLGGIAAANIHGKNNFAVGTVGDAILEFDLVTPAGRTLTCSREANAELFHAAIGGFGLLGVFARLKLVTKRVHSGELEVHTFAGKNLRELMAYVQHERASADYLVGWIDGLARGDRIGRGQIHRARYLAPGEDPEPGRTLTLAHQELSPMAFGVFPKSEMWRILRLFNNDLGMRLINEVRYWQGRLEGALPPRRWTHNAFSFLLDTIPWKWAYGRRTGHGLIQFQPFVPDAEAHHVFHGILERSVQRGFPPYLAVLKRHRPDPFWLTHAVDGWSLALDYKVTPSNRAALFAFCRELAEDVVAAGGRFYFAKDAVLAPGTAARTLPRERWRAFARLRAEHDPEGLLESALWRRVGLPHDPDQSMSA